MRTPVTLLAAFAVMPFARAQTNLIENGDFETFTGGDCPARNVHEDGNTPSGKGWSIFNQTPDHLCSYTGGGFGQESPHIYRADIAHSGKGYIFLYGNSASIGAEAYQYTLARGLKDGQSYTLSFWGKDPANFEGGSFLLKGASGTVYASQNLQNVRNWTNYSFTFTPVVHEKYLLFTTSAGNRGVVIDDITLGQTGPLPLRLLTFQATAQAGVVALQWEMAEDADIATYTIERSRDGYGYQVVGTLEATADKGSKSYSFTDGDAPADAELFYRIRLVEKSGVLHFTWTVPVTTQPDRARPLTVAPNPTDGDIQLSGLNEKGEIKIYSADGVMRMLRKTDGHQTKIETASLPAGTYFLQYTSGNEITIRSFIRK